MKRLFLKSLLYVFLILLSLELLVRAFHLTKDYPERYVDDFGVEKWMPNQEGYSVTGNRRQNFSEYHINSFGYNSYREFNPSKDKIEIALVGDSFIEGFHQNYYHSLGNKIENQLQNIEVYEYGYAGYDLADQLHLINRYKDQFDLIDFVVIGIKFENDLLRSEYSIVQERLVLESSMYKLIRRVKLLVYLQSIGVLDVPKNLVANILSYIKNDNTPKGTKIEGTASQKKMEVIHNQYIKNFQSLIDRYGFDKNRFVFLLDSEQTPDIFLTYLNDHQFKYLDFSPSFKASKRPTTLIYDKHWNNHGRSLLANLIANYIKTQFN